MKRNTFLKALGAIVVAPSILNTNNQALEPKEFYDAEKVDIGRCDQLPQEVLICRITSKEILDIYKKTGIIIYRPK